MAAIRIKYKILLSFLCVGITLIALVGWLGYSISSRSLTHASFESLAAMREMKKSQIERYFDQLRQECLALARIDTTIQSMKAFKDAFYKVKDELKISKEQLEQYTHVLKQHYNQVINKVKTVSDIPLTFQELAPHNDNALILQYLHIVKYKSGTYATGTTDIQFQVDKADVSTYTKLFNHYAPLFAYLAGRFKVYDIYLVDLDTGYVVFEMGNRGEVVLEIDFANNIIDGGLKDTNLADALLYIKNSPDKMASKLVDFEFYIPSFGNPSAFIAVPIFDGDKKIGALAVELAVDEINAIMTNNHKWEEIGLGNTGESYLVGSDYKMRSISRLLIENPTRYFDTLEALGMSKLTLDRIKVFNTSILLQDVATAQAQAALRGETDVISAQDYRGTQVFSAYAPLAIPDVHWGIITKIDKDEALAPVNHLARLLIISTLFLIILLGLLSLPLARWVMYPITVLNTIVAHIVQQPIGTTDYTVPPLAGDLGILTQNIDYYYKRVFKVWQEIEGKTAALATLLYTLQDQINTLKNTGQVKQELFDTQELLSLLYKALNTLKHQQKESEEHFAKLSIAIADIQRNTYYADVDSHALFESSSRHIQERLEQALVSLRDVSQRAIVDAQIQDNALLYTERLSIKIQDAQAKLVILMQNIEKLDNSMLQLFNLHAQLKELEQGKHT